MGALLRGCFWALVLLPFSSELVRVPSALWTLAEMKTPEAALAPVLSPHIKSAETPNLYAPKPRTVLPVRHSAAANAQSAAAPEKPVPVKIAAAAPAPEAGQIVTTGTLTYKRELTLSFKTGGVVRAYAVDIGDPVKAGDPLISADPTDTAGRRGEAEAAYDSARANLKRAEELNEKGFVSEARLEEAKSAYKRAEAAYNSAKYDESRAALKSPVNGVVLIRHAEIGQQLAPGAPVITVGDAQSGLILRAPLSDRDIVRIRTGDKSVVTAPGLAQKVHGQVARLAAKADRLTGAFDVEIALGDAPAGTRSGLVGEAEITPSGSDGSEKLLAVPAIALLEGRGNEAYVYIIGNDNRARRMAVTIARFLGEKVLLARGLSPGDRVVTSGAAYLRNGQAVTILPESWPQSASRAP